MILKLFYRNVIHLGSQPSANRATERALGRSEVAENQFSKAKLFCIIVARTAV
jgi:hypothetical protein